MRQTRHQEWDFALLDHLDKPRPPIQADLGIALRPDLLGVKIPLSERAEGEGELDEGVEEEGVGEGEDGTGDFLVVEVGHELVGAEFGFVGGGDVVEAFVVV